MDISQIYILVIVVVLAVIMAMKRKRERPISKITIFAFLLIISGIVFGERGVMGYGLIGAGAAIAAVDIFRRWRRAVPKND